MSDDGKLGIDDSAASHGRFESIEMGLLEDFMSQVDILAQRFPDRDYRFKSLDKGDFWLFEEEDDEEIVGGIFQVTHGRVYAISRDVFDLVSKAFARENLGAFGGAVFVFFFFF